MKSKPSIRSARAGVRAAIEERQRLVLCAALIAAVTVFAFWPPTNMEFVTYDDHEYVTENPIVQAGLTSDGVRWAFTTDHTGNWHPLTWLSIMLDCQLFGLNRTGHYATSLALHTLSALILFAAFYRMTGAVWQSFVIAILFAIHPLRVESVAWAAERKDVLSGFFWMLTIFAYSFYVRRRNLVRYIAVAAMFALGLLAKPMLVTMPFVLLLLDFWPLKRIQLAPAGQVKEPRNIHWRRAVIEKLPLLAMVAGSIMITLIVQRRATATWEGVSLGLRIANACVSYLMYIVKVVWPSGLAVFYPHPLQAISPVLVAVAIIVLGIISFFSLRWMRQRPFFIVGWLWYLGTLVPVIGIVQVGAQAMADRYSYLPLVGIFAIVAWGGGILLERVRISRSAVVGGITALTAVLVFITRQQVSYWQNSITLFEHAIEVTDRNYVAESSLAVGLERAGRRQEAIQHAKQAIAIKPDYAEAQNNLGSMLAHSGNLTEAISYYRDAVRSRPDYATAHFNLGFYLYQLGNVQEAVQHYEEAVRIQPSYADARLNLGNAYMALGRRDDGMQQYYEIVRWNPRYEKALYVIGFYLAADGKHAEAVEYYRRAIAVKPDYAEVHYYLGQSLVALGRAQEAIQHYNAALSIRGIYPEARAALNRISQNQ
jgi:tetratricopeptide (TPR) repeat protein